MSDQIMGGGVATEEPPTEAPETSVTGSRRNLIVVGVAVAAALAVAVWFLFLSGGGSSAPSGAVPASTANPNGAGTGAAPKASASHSAKPVKSANPTDKGRNPFTPLLTEPTATPTPTAPPAVPASSPSASGAASTPSSSASTSVPAGSNIVATVSLTKVSGKTASFSVAASGTTTKYSGIAVGETFATFFKLYDLGSKCAQIQYGDQTGPSCLGAPLVLYSAS